MNEFDPITHVYRQDGYEVPSVTRVLHDVLPGWDAGEYAMALGRANHACYALLGEGKTFDAAPECLPYCATWQEWKTVNSVDVISVETKVYSRKYQFAGTLDAVSKVGGVVCLVDYKNTLTKIVEFQLAAYSMAFQETTGQIINTGRAVEIRPEGWRMSTYSLSRAKNEWLGLLTAYRVRRKAGIKEDR